MTPEEKLASSGITPANAARLGIISLQAQAVEALGFPPAPALMIPYFGLDGEETGFYRIRYLESVRNWKGEELRYMQPPGTLTGVHLPRLPGIDWAAISVDPTVQLVLTEGELKADCACIRGILTIALGGVNSYRSGRYSIELLDPLDRFNWTGRSVVIAFDSDAAHKPRVVEAQTHLVQLLIQRGALPTVVSIPPTTTGAKQGLDDYLIQFDSPLDAWEELLKTGQEAAEAVALWKMNSEYCVIQMPGAVVHTPTRYVMKTDEFRTLHAANKTYQKRVVFSNGSVRSTTEALAPAWLKWSQRRGYTSLVYRPGEEEVVDLPMGHTGLNLWQGWAVEPVEGDIDPWNDLLEFVFRSEPQNRRWFEQWCAYPIQNPGGKMFSYVLFWSHAQGVGKTLIPYILMDIYGKADEGYSGPVNSIEIKNSDLTGDFNSWQRQKQFVYGDEVGGEFERRKIDANTIKQITTQEIATVNEKYIPKYSVRNVANYMFSSNYADAFSISRDDRRAYVHEVMGPPMPGSWYDRIADWRLARGARHLMYHLQRVDLTGFRPHDAPPTTAAKRNMATLSFSDTGAWVDELRHNPYDVLVAAGVPAQKAAECDLYTASQLLRMFDPTGTVKVSLIGFSRILAMSGLRIVNGGNPVHTAVGSVKMIAIRNQMRWHRAEAAELRTHFESYNNTGAPRRTT